MVTDEELAWVLEAIYAAWRLNRGLRLDQLLWKIVDGDPYYIENEVLIALARNEVFETPREQLSIEEP